LIRAVDFSIANAAKTLPEPRKRLIQPSRLSLCSAAYDRKRTATGIVSARVRARRRDFACEEISVWGGLATAVQKRVQEVETMRSELVTAALKPLSNRYQLTRLTAKAIQALHRPDTRIADTANDVLLHFGLRSPSGRARPVETQGDRTSRPDRHRVAPSRSKRPLRSPDEAVRFPATQGTSTATAEQENQLWI
jgi:hypothetical protein